jgi:hypothetical protein
VKKASKKEVEADVLVVGGMIGFKCWHMVGCDEGMYITPQN